MAVCPPTLTPAEVVVRFGDPASVNCSTSATDVLGMGWEAPIGGTGFVDPPTVTWTVERLQDWSINPKCYITLKNNHQCDAMPTITLYSEYKSTNCSVHYHIFISRSLPHIMFDICK